MRPPSLAYRFAAVAALIGWSALAAQLYLSLRLGVENGRGLFGGLIIYLGYFTILTNALVAAALTAAAFSSRTGVTAGLVRFFLRPGVNTAIATNIVLVGLTYSLLLRQVWDPQGLQWITDEVLHDVMPVLFILYWWFAVPTRGLRWSSVYQWTLYPAGYFVYSIASGELLEWYPYPFFDVGVFGYGRVFLNGAGILAVFIAIALLLIAIGRLRDRVLLRGSL